MKPIEYRHTLALLRKIKDDLSHIAFILRIAVQISLLLYYSFSIYSHVSSLPYLIIYSILLLLSVLVFADNLFSYRKGKEGRVKHKKRHQILAVCGILDKVSLLVVSLIPIIQGKASDFDKVAIRIRTVILLSQTAFLFASSLFEKYLLWLKEAIELDYKESLISFKPSQALSDKIHDFARNLTGRKEEENSPLQEKLKDRIEENRKKEKEKKKEKKRERKKQRRQDISRIINYYSEKRRKKKMTEDKIDKAILDAEKKADKISSHNDKLAKVLAKVEGKRKNSALPDSLSVLGDYLSALKRGSLNFSSQQKKYRLVNLLYYLDPLVPDKDTIEDEKRVLRKTKDKINLALPREEKQKKK